MSAPLRIQNLRHNHDYFQKPNQSLRDFRKHVQRTPLPDAQSDCDAPKTGLS